MIEAQKDALRKILKREPTHAHVFTSQFPSFLYTIENTAQDMEMLILAVEKLESTKYRDVDKPGLGLIVMRALYYLQNDTIAQQVRFWVLENSTWILCINGSNSKSLFS